MHHIFTPSRESEKIPFDGHRRHHPALKIIIRCVPHLYTVDNIIELHERLAHRDENPLTAFSIRGKSGVYDWHRRLRPVETLYGFPPSFALVGVLLRRYMNLVITSAQKGSARLESHRITHAVGVRRLCSTKVSTGPMR